MNRRDFLKSAGLFFLSSPFLNLQVQATEGEDDHFLIYYIVSGGVDNHYWFDPKSKALTAHNLKQNYVAGTDAELMRPIVDKRGYNAFCTPMVEKLWKDHQDCFSIFRGVYMSTSFDGHENNLTMLLTGQALASGTFLPYISRNSLLEYVEYGLVKDNILDSGAGANLSATLIRNLQKTMKGSAATGEPPGERFIQERLKALKAEDLLGKNARRVSDALSRRQQMTEALNGFNMDSAPSGLAALTPDVASFFPVVRDTFRNRVSRVALIRDGGLVALDGHGANTAKTLPDQVYPAVVANLDRFFRYLKETPYKGDKKLIDVCTVVVTSEFNRTYRSLVVGGVDVNDTGTDHNTFANSVWLGGKGIKKGWICGETDLNNVGSDGKFTEVSRAHRDLDPFLVKACGLPFDPATMMAVKPAMDAGFQKNRYLHYNSVINTVLQMFGQSDRKMPIEGTSTPAPILTGILA